MEFQLKQKDIQQHSVKVLRCCHTTLTSVFVFKIEFHLFHFYLAHAQARGIHSFTYLKNRGFICEICHIIS